MAVYRRSTRTRPLLVVLVLLAVTLVTIDGRSSGSGALSGVRGAVHDVLAPIQGATHRALAPIGNFLTGAAEYGSLRAENERLRRQIAAMQSQSVSAGASQAEAGQVIAGAHLPFVGSVPTVPARVIDQGSSNFQNVVTVDKGSADGLVVGQPVVAAGMPGSTGGLVGSVGSVSRHTATIDLMTDPNFVVGVRLDGVNTGTAEGIGAGQSLKVTVITTKEPPPKMTKGQPVSTSGLQFERYPAGIPVGTVESTTTSPGEQEPTITLKPMVNLSELSLVEIELWSPQTPPAP